MKQKEKTISESCSFADPDINLRDGILEKNKQIDNEITKIFFDNLQSKLRMELLDAIADDNINGGDTTLTKVISEKIRKEVKQKMEPYLRDGSKIVYYCSSRKCYKARIPKALLLSEKKIPQYGKTELEMWKKLYDYLFGLKAEKVTLEILFPEWMKQRENDKDLASNTIRRNKQIWEKYYHNHELIKLSIEKIKASQIKQFYKEYTQGRNITRRELGNIKIIMNGLFSMAVEHDMIMSNVALAVNTRDLKCKVVHNNDMIYTKNERDALLTYLETIPDNAYTLGISLMFCLDVRIGELKALNWSDYNADRKTITIQREIVDRYDDNGKWSQVELDHTKAGEGGDRVEPVSPRAQKILERLKKLNPDCNRIILNSSGTTLKTNKFNLYLKKYCTGCGIRYFSSHKMRFYAVTEQAKAGMDLVTIQYLSGHKNPDTTFKYMRTARLTNESNDKWDKVFN